MAKTPILAEFVPQVWQNDYAVNVDPEGPASWDVTDTILALSKDAALRLRDDDYDTDALRFHTNAPKWVQDWCGPFYVAVHSSIEDYFAADES